jgi:hypothetical protein
MRPVLRGSALRLLGVTGCMGAIAGCGSATTHRDAPIRLQVSSSSTVHTASATITGTVAPATARVLVLGHAVTVHEGSFSTRVSLAPGTNLIDVLAGAPRAHDAMTAVRVFRQVYVAVPTLSGANPTDAEQRLRRLGLVPDINKNEPFFSFLIPGSDAVCGTDPAAGAKVAPGSKVTVTVSKTC